MAGQPSYHVGKKAIPLKQCRPRQLGDFQRLRSILPKHRKRFGDYKPSSQVRSAADALYWFLIGRRFWHKNASATLRQLEKIETQRQLSGTQIIRISQWNGISYQSKRAGVSKNPGAARASAKLCRLSRFSAALMRGPNTCLPCRRRSLRLPLLLTWARASRQPMLQWSAAGQRSTPRSGGQCELPWSSR